MKELQESVVSGDPQSLRQEHLVEGVDEQIFYMYPLNQMPQQKNHSAPTI